MSEENTAPATDVGSDAGSSVPTGGSEGSGGGFSFDSWDGNRDNLPDEHHGAYDAFQKTRQEDVDEKNQRLLAETLNSRYSEQDAQRRANQAKIDAQRRAQEPTALTTAELDREFRKRELRQTQSKKVQSFREGMVEIVSKPQQYGEATVTFASNDEVAAFENWMDGMFKGKMTPHDMLKIYRFDQIMKSNKDSAVRNFEKGLKGRKQSVNDGGGDTQLSRSNNSGDKAAAGGSRRIPSLEDFIKAENPAAHNAIVGGKINPLEHI